MFKLRFLHTGIKRGLILFIFLTLLVGTNPSPAMAEAALRPNADDPGLPGPGIPTLVSPSGYLGTDDTPTFVWNVVTDAEVYLLQVIRPGILEFAQTYPEGDICGASTCSVTLPGGSALDGGEHLWAVRAYSAAENYGEWSETWTINIEPDTSITDNPTDPSNDTNLSFSFESDDPDATFECQMDGGGFSSCTSPQVYATLAGGMHTFDVRAIENLGNPDATPASYSWIVDATPPDTTITSTPDDPTNSTNASFQFSSTEVGSTFECQLDSGGFSSCTSPEAYMGLSEGSHTFDVRATDSVGNTDPTPDSYTWEIDLTPPSVLSSVRADDNPTDAASVDFTVTFSESVTGVNGGDFSLNTTGVSGASISGVSGSGDTYTVSVNTGSGEGTIRLDVDDNDSIMDDADNPLGGAGAGNGDFTSGEEYTITYVADVDVNI